MDSSAYNSPFISDVDIHDPSSSSSHLPSGAANQHSPFESAYRDFNTPGSPLPKQQSGSVPETPYTTSYAAQAGSYNNSPYGSDISFIDQQGNIDFASGQGFDSADLDFSLIDIGVIPPSEELDDYEPAAYDAPDHTLLSFSNDFMAALPMKEQIRTTHSSSPSLSSSSLGSTHPHSSLAAAQDAFDPISLRTGSYSPFDQGSPSSSNGDVGLTSTDQFGQVSNRSRASSVSSVPGLLATLNQSQQFSSQQQQERNATYGLENVHFSSPSPGPWGPNNSFGGQGPRSPPPNKPQSPTLVIPSQSSILPPEITHTANSPSPTSTALGAEGSLNVPSSFASGNLGDSRLHGGLAPGGPGIEIVPATPVSAGAAHGVNRGGAPFQQSVEQQSSRVSSQPSWAQSSSSPLPQFQHFSDPSRQRGHSRTPSNGTISPQPQQRLPLAPPSPFNFPIAVTPPPIRTEGQFKQSPQASPQLGALQLGLEGDQSGDPSFLLAQSNARSRSKSDTSLRPPMWQLGIGLDNGGEDATENKVFDQSYSAQQLPNLVGLGGSASANNSPSINQLGLPHHSFGPPAQQNTAGGTTTILDPNGSGATNNGFLSPNFTFGGVPGQVRRSRSDSAGLQASGHRRNAVSEDYTRRIPHSNQLFPPQTSFGFPGIRGQSGSNPSSAGGSPLLGQQYLQPLGGELGGITNISGGLGAHRRSFSHGNHHGHSRSVSRERVSLQTNPYPSPHASPRANTNEALPSLPSITTDNGGVQVHVMGVDANGQTTVQSAAPLNVPRPNVTTHATADASQRRRRTEANFVCPVPGCGSTFTRHFNLKGHLRSHNEERPFKCKWPGCDKGFARQHDCKRHEQLHLNIRPYVCQGCNRQFARMDALNRHLRSDAGTDCQARQPLLTSEQPNNPNLSHPSAGLGKEFSQLESFNTSWEAGVSLTGVTL